MGRMKGNQIQSVTALAVSQISDSVECESSGHASHERPKRNRRGRRTNLAAGDSRKSSGEHLSRNSSSKISDSSNSCRSTSNSPSNPEFCGTAPQVAYAGARFGDSPSPRLLPPPPLHWISGGMIPAPVFGSCVSLTSELKTLLQVA